MKEAFKSYSYIVNDDFTLDVVEDTSEVSDVDLNRKQEEKTTETPLLRKRQCEECEFNTEDKDLFMKHFEAHLRLNTPPHECEKCNYQALTKADLISHQSRCQISNARFTCPHCMYATIKPSTVRRHIRNYHAEVPVFKCSTCPFQTHRWDLANTHKIHLKRKIKCELCNYETSSTFALARHHRTTHLFKCHRCPFETTVKEELESHKRTHAVNKVKIYQCDLCGFESRFRQSVKVHREIHMKDCWGATSDAAPK